MIDFQEAVWDYYAKHGRDLPWRQPEYDGTFDPYKILVSEIMLQQTQVNRIAIKYQPFLDKFPEVKTLADAPLSIVLTEWSGLGYNRRAKFLHEAAKRLAGKSEPWTFEELVACKGIGPNTAAAVLTYAYNQQHAFIETNIRTVFIHHFFQDKIDISDKELLPLVEKALDQEHPREWSWSLMDYGVHLKTTVGNLSRQSKHYAKQSTFVGSKRQVRGRVLRLLQEGSTTHHGLARRIEDERLAVVLGDLVREGLVTETGDTFRLG